MLIRVGLFMALLALPGFQAFAQEAIYPHPVVYWVDWIGTELAFATEPAHVPAPGPPSASAELLLVREELAGLRRELADLRATMDEYLGGVVASLQRENVALRQDLARRQPWGGGAPPETSSPQVPRPAGVDLVPEVVSEPPPVTSHPPISSGPPPYEVVKAWGRTPEVAAELGGDVAALKGMVLTIPSGTPSRAIEALGRALRREFDDYENINIEVFESAEAADAYLEHPTAQPQGRVLSVSRQAASGLDTILITENGITMDVPR